MAALVIASEEEQRVRVVNLERPQVQHTLRGEREVRGGGGELRLHSGDRASMRPTHLHTKVSTINIVTED